MVTSERLSVEGDQEYAQSGMGVAPRLAWILTAKESLEVSLSNFEGIRTFNVSIVNLFCRKALKCEQSIA